MSKRITYKLQLRTILAICIYIHNRILCLKIIHIAGFLSCIGLDTIIISTV